MRICGFLTCVCLQVYSSASPLRLGPQRVGLAFASDAASGCKPEFSHACRLALKNFPASVHDVWSAEPSSRETKQSSNFIG